VFNINQVLFQFDTALRSVSIVGARHPGHSLRSRGRLSSGRMEVIRSEYGLFPTSFRPEDRAPTQIRSGQNQIETALEFWPQNKASCHSPDPGIVKLIESMLKTARQPWGATRCQVCHSFVIMPL